MPSFVHLHVHSEYSLIDSVIRIKPLLTQTAETMPAIALTDFGNMMASVKFYRACLANGVKPILGCELLIADTLEGEAFPMVLLVQNDAGYRHLTRLVSRSYLEGQHKGRAVVLREWLTGQCEGIIALSGSAGEIGQALLAGNDGKADAALRWAQSLFSGRLYLELCRCGRADDERHVALAVALAAQHELPVVATNDVRYLSEDDFEAHEARVCIHQGRTLSDPRRARSYTPQQYLRSAEQMTTLFADLPEAIENTVEIAKRCNATLTLGESVLPDFPIPEGMTEAEYFRHSSHEGLVERLKSVESDHDTYRARLERELDVIIQMGFPGYFLIVADFIRWARDNDIPVGPGRGSGAGSLVAYALGITDIDPLPYDLLFERFLNPERVSMPDFDIDFCMDNRDRVIQYVAECYGEEKVSQIITFGSMAAKAVVRDVGRVQSLPYGFVDGVSKLVPFEVGMTLTKALVDSPDLKQRYEDEDEVRQLIDMALRLEGLARNCGKHAGGVVIAPSGLTDFCPLYCEEGGSVVTQFDKDDAEAVGLVKFDFLGLRTLTILHNAVRLIKSTCGVEIELANIALDDAATFTQLQNAQTTAIFQLESRGMKELIKRLQPDSFEDIIALVALFRPGPLQSGMVDDFINRKHGREPLAYPHPDYQLDMLKPVLEPTYGIILYQEQVMKIAQEMAGFSLGGADLLRRAMGKKKPEEMAKQKAGFLEGCEAQGIDTTLAEKIFDLVEKFAGYGFNKSHSAAYALLSYQTAWLKCHYPAPFMAAVLSADMDNTDKVTIMVEECRAMGLTLLPPDINASGLSFSVPDAKTIRYGLGAIKGAGESALQDILQQREQDGAFADLGDMVQRVDPSRVNKRVLESLVLSGACDSLGHNRRSYIQYIPEAMRAAEQRRRDRDSGQDDLFGTIPETVVGAPVPQLPEFAHVARLQHEKEALGLYLTGHPADAYREELERLGGGSLATLCARAPAPVEGQRWQKGIEVTAAGWVSSVRSKYIPSGKMGLVTLEDSSGRIEVMLPPDRFAQYGDQLQADTVILFEGDLAHDDFSGGFRLRAKALYKLAEARAHRGAAVRMVLNDAYSLDAVTQLQRWRADPVLPALPVVLELAGKHSGGRVWLGGDYRMGVDDAQLEALREWSSCREVSIEYAR